MNKMVSVYYSKNEHFNLITNKKKYEKIPVSSISIIDIREYTFSASAGIGPLN